MSGLQQIEADLRFVRRAVARREEARGQPAAVYRLWAAYVLVGYALLDLAPPVAGLFFPVAGVACGLVSGVLAKRWAGRVGQYDRAAARRRQLHFFGGVSLSVLAGLALAAAIPALRGPGVGQVTVVMIGLVYFLAGVHYDRNLLWLGPVLVAGGVAVGFVPAYGWTCLGAVIAAGLVVPTWLVPRPQPVPDPDGRPGDDEGAGRES